LLKQLSNQLKHNASNSVLPGHPHMA